MAQKKILTIGFELADESAEYSSFDNNISLLDWDVILIRPDIYNYINQRESTFQGKPHLSDNDSFRLKAQSEHWRREIKTAVEHGKLVIVYLCDKTPISIATGEKRTSGTGRNQKVTRIVTSYDNYQFLPCELELTSGKGREMKLSNNNSQIVSSYWKQFSVESTYTVTIESKDTTKLILTKNGDKEVGSIIRSNNSNGALLLLPDLDFYQDEFINDENEWTSKGELFAKEIIREVVLMTKLINSSGDITPPPNWVESEEFMLKQEITAYESLLRVEEKIQAIQREKEHILSQTKDLARLRNLLFEKGKPLEHAIIESLVLMGFRVSQFDNGESEFDAVFVSEEGRFIGEAEGKDNKAINIDKLRQIALNIHEDLMRDEIQEPAKSVLFGNPYPEGF
ncbi:hypothetical protein LTK23_24195 [Klebsiella quasipneumoniae subsp. quasipneumoniae]|uniref:hypothetical protein n=1 Tax=Klebsiella quasipneumoniae TaxID=1463165 RepID=UPI001E6315E5|nr:hypothetical protein [Klebsiella quasipneumoniae]MCD7096489.1 hypothetical protein [Klebsiella quasipneumoniae subsp. similipneumoniae]